jgi:hypothetical protein|nr:hypothetical protein HULAa50H9_00006 [Candidatus Nanopelagicales bacterium]
MEVFTGSTPTYSGNYKANLETFPDEYISDTPKAILLLELGISLVAKWDTKRLPRLNIWGSK